MGIDRAFFSDQEHGFQIWKPERQILQPGTGSVCTAEVNIPADGRYVIQFQCDYTLTVEFGDVLYDSSRFPMMHSGMREFPLDLKQGKAKLQVRLSNPTDREIDGTFAARLLDEEGNILAPEKVISLPVIEATKRRARPELIHRRCGQGVPQFRTVRFLQRRRCAGLQHAVVRDRCPSVCFRSSAVS